jgi:hypothetical protein
MLCLFQDNGTAVWSQLIVRQMQVAVAAHLGRQHWFFNLFSVLSLRGFFSVLYYNKESIIFKKKRVNIFWAFQMMDLAQKALGRAAFQMTRRRLFRLINIKELNIGFCQLDQYDLSDQGNKTECWPLFLQLAIKFGHSKKLEKWSCLVC